MPIRDFGELGGMTITAPDAEKRVRFLLDFHETKPPESIQFETTEDMAMGLMQALQRYQALHQLPIPASLRPQGKPTLSVVGLEE